jgi:hypothetical protein
MDDYYPDYDGEFGGGLMYEHLIGEGESFQEQWDNDGVLGDDPFEEGGDI